MSEKIVVETFRRIGGYELSNMEQKEPSCFNSDIRIEKYRVTVEIVQEPKEVIHARLEKLWVECGNVRHREPLRAMAKKHGYTFKGQYGSRSKKCC